MNELKDNTAVVQEDMQDTQNTEIPQNPIFEEIKTMDPEGALNVLVQAAGQAQASGSLTVRDSVMVAQAITILRPGSI